MPLPSDQQKQALQEEAETLLREPPTAQTAARLREIEQLLGTAPNDEERMVEAARRSNTGNDS